MHRLRRRWEVKRQKPPLHALRRDPHLARDLGLTPLPRSTNMPWPHW